MNSSKAKGSYFEQEAVRFLQKNNFKIVEQNFYAKKIGEIDIVAKQNDIYHFIEVKSGDSFEAVYNITPLKISKLKRSIQYYLQKKDLNNVAYCLDAIIFSKDKLEFLENITL